jgi:hypothetical protein
VLLYRIFSYLHKARRGYKMTTETMPEDNAAKPPGKEPAEAQPVGGVSRPEDQGRQRGEAPTPRDPTAAAVHPDATFMPLQSDALAPGPVRPDPILGRPDGTQLSQEPPHIPDEPESAPMEEERNLVEQFRNYPPEIKQYFRDQAAEKSPAELARTIAEQEVLSKDDARSLLNELYKNREGEVEAALQGAGEAFKSKEELAPEPEPEFTPEERVMQQEFEEDLVPEAERVMAMPEGDDKKEATARLRDKLGEKAGKTAGKVLKYSTVGGGIFAFLLMLLLVAHTPNKQ